MRVGTISIWRKSIEGVFFVFLAFFCVKIGLVDNMVEGKLAYLLPYLTLNLTWNF